MYFVAITNSHLLYFFLFCHLALSTFLSFSRSSTKNYLLVDSANIHQICPVLGHIYLSLELIYETSPRFLLLKGKCHIFYIFSLSQHVMQSLSPRNQLIFSGWLNEKELRGKYKWREGDIWVSIGWWNLQDLVTF